LPRIAAAAKEKQKIFFYQISKEETRAITFLEGKMSSSSSSRSLNGLLSPAEKQQKRHMNQVSFAEAKARRLIKAKAASGRD
jgi:hypothetical protein